MNRTECKNSVNNKECEKGQIEIVSLGRWDPDRVLTEGLLRSLRNGSKIGGVEGGTLLFGRMDGLKRDNEKIKERIIISSEEGKVLVNIDIGKDKNHDDKVICVEVKEPRGMYESTINWLVGAGILSKEGLKTL